MSKAVLCSIRPEYCELILDGKKTVEVRKSIPKLDIPFKCYIYCTYGFGLIEYKDECLPNHLLSQKVSTNKKWDNCCNGKVIGEFTCDKIACYSYNSDGYGIKDEKELCAASGLKSNELYHYLQGLKPYAWHISDLVIYDKPKELSDFEGLRKTKFGYEPVEIKRPPQ